jgi:hypothetical protein
VDEGYLVASIEVDGVNLTFADTKNLLFEILRSVRGQGLSASAPVVDLYARAVERGYRGPELYHGAVQRNQINYDIVAALRRQNLLAEVDDILEMHLTSSPEMAAADVRKSLAERLRGTAYDGGSGVTPLIGQAVEGRPFDLMVALFAIAAIAVAQGSRGLLISFDEWEVQASSAAAYQRMLQQLKVMEFFFLDERYSAQPISFVVFNVPGGDGPEAKEQDTVETLVQQSGGARYRIPLLGGWDRPDKEVKGLAQRIHALYVEAYAISEPMGEKEYWHRLDQGMRQVDFQESGATRMMLKMMVSVLDAAYGPPQRRTADS